MSLLTNPLQETETPSLNTAEPRKPESIVDAIRGLTGSLQTTLEVEEQLQIFADRVAGVVPVDGVRYRHADYELETLVGKRGPYRCSYRLTLWGADLGEVIFTRRVRFGEKELKRLETLICALLHPLRNGLLYLEAVRAAHRDPLTGLGNRAAFESALHREVTLSRRHGHPLALLNIDIDFFKHINDRHGHAAGDRMLQHFAAVAKGAIRDSDLLFRYGGEEFVAVLANTEREGALAVAERIRAEVDKSECECGNHRLHITISLGAAVLTEKGDGRQLFEDADAALYHAKNAGRNRAVLHSDG